MVLLRAVGDMPKSAAAARKLRNLATAIAASNSIKPDLLIILKIRMGNAALCALSVQSSVPISNAKEKAHGFELERKKGPRDGSSSGLGEAIVKMLAQEGAAVVVHGRDSVRVDVIVKAISDAGGRADRTLGDLTTDAGADKVCGSRADGGLKRSIP